MHAVEIEHLLDSLVSASLPGRIRAVGIVHDSEGVNDRKLAAAFRLFADYMELCRLQAVVLGLLMVVNVVDALADFPRQFH